LGEECGFVSSGAIKNVVTSIWEAEVNAASDAADIILYTGMLAGSCDTQLERSGRLWEPTNRPLPGWGVLM
jgi:hypothetical protein